MSSHVYTSTNCLQRPYIIAHIAFLVYMIRHKWYVFRACLALGVPFYQALSHDWTKFTPSEWFSYVNRFRHVPPHRLAMGRVGYYRYGDDPAFDRAREQHWQNNPHHWQYWCRRDADGTLRPQAIPPNYAREMVSDWIGASKAQGNGNMLVWYQANKEKLLLHEQTRCLVDEIIAEAVEKGIV